MYEERVGADNSEVFQNESALIQEIVDNIIYIYLDYSYDDMPMGGWDENPFDGRLCEKDYAEIIVVFLFHVGWYRYANADVDLFIKL